MEKKIRGYKVVISGEPIDIERQVNTYILAGWEPYGALCVIPPTAVPGVFAAFNAMFVQPMITYNGIK